MPLPTPVLDDRSFAQLRDELVRRIPVYTPEWTDHNASDPGITLLELFAFLGENLLFRFNQIPESTRLAFLRLLQVPLRPATAARGLVQMSLATGGDTLVEQGSEAKAGSISFETQDEVHVWPLRFQGLARLRRDLPDSEEIRAYAAAAVDARGLAANERPVYYVNELVPEEPARPGAVAVDFGATVDGMVWVAVLRTPETDPDRLGGAVLNLGFIPDEQVTGMADVDACPGEGATSRGDEIQWEVSTGRLGAGGEPVYRAVSVVGDTTRGLTRQGVVRLRLPPDPLDLADFPLADPDLAGTGNLPPALEDEEQAADLLFWLRAYRRRDDQPLKRMLWIGGNAAEVVQRKRARPEFLGTGAAQPDQRFALVHTPVVPGSLVLEVEEPDGWRAWREVDGFHASGEDDRVYVLDSASGEVRFGTGVRGRAPQIGERMRAREYQYGGGPDGNVAAGAITRLDGIPTVKLANPLPARGGAPAESIEAALDRVPGELRRRDRAVTRGDFRELALATPGADVGRAEVLPLFDPSTLNREAAGVVSVVVWPREDLKHPDAPMPDRVLLRAVCAWLDARRLVTTELYVIPPTYRRVAVAVGLQVRPGYGVEAVRRWVELVIRQYLAPLPPFGPSGEGWPLGRRVHGPELEAAALQVEGVEYLEGLDVAGWDEDGRRWVRGTVVLEPYEVPELAEITVVEGAPEEPGVAVAPPPRNVPDTDDVGVPVPIPILREEC